MTTLEEDTSVYLTDVPIAPAPRAGRRVGGLTAALVLVLVGGAGFVAGVKVQKHEAPAAATTAGFAALANRAARTGTSTPPGAGGFGGATIGTVRLVDGDTIYVATTSGDIVKVKTTKGSTVSKSSTASVSDIHPGDSVVVQGDAGSDGTVTANRITDGAAGAGAGGGGRRFGGG